MSRKQQQNQQDTRSRPARYLTLIEFRAITFLATLLLAGIAIIRHVNEPVVWSFLATAIGITIGQAIQKR